MAGNVIEFTIKGVDKFTSVMKGVGESIKHVGGKIVSLGKWVAASAAALVAFVKIMANGIDTTAKFASRIGVAADQLSKMQFVASQAGISTEQFNMATQRMVRRVAEAAKGMGEATSALSELNINAKEFKTLGLEQQYAKIADAMKNVKDPADKLRLAFKLFDSEGTAVLQMMKGGSTAMQQAAKDAEFLGLAITNKAAAAAEHFDDSMGRAEGSIKGASRAIAGVMMPVLSGLANRFANFLANNRENIVTFIKGAVEKFFTLLEVIGQVWTGIKKIFTDPKAFAKFLDNMGAFIKAGSVMFVAFSIGLVKIFWEGIKAMTSVLNAFGDWLGKKIYDIFHKGSKSAGDFSKTMTDSIFKAVHRAGNAIELGLKEPMDVFALATKDAGTALADGLGVNIDEAQAKAKKAIAGLSEFGKVTKKNLEDTGASLSELMQTLTDQQRLFMDELRNNSTEFAKTLYDTIKGTIDMVSQGIAQVIVYGGSLTETFKKIAQQVLSSIIAAFIKMGVQRLLLSALTKSVTTSEASAEAGKAVGLAGANMFASWAAAPWPISLGAPAAAAAAVAGAAASFTAGAATGAGLGAAIGGVAHGGMTSVPKESTYLLDKGERVLSPNQNRDFTDFISGGGAAGGGVTIENISISILPNATNADALLKMRPTEMENLVAGPIIRALNSLNKKGIRPEFIKRGV